VNVVFFGTADFGIPTLEALHKSARHRLIVAVTGPDRPRGRGLSSQPTPVGEWLTRTGIDKVLKPDKLSDPAFVELLRAAPADAYVVVAYRILPDSVYTIPRHAFNLHASLLPAYRGAAPIQRAIMAGEKVTGVTTFLLQTKVDAGDIVLQRAVEIGPEENTGELMSRLAAVGAGAVIETLDLLESGSFAAVVQDPTNATAAPKITDADVLLSFAQPCRTLVNHVRALAPRPGATAVFRENTVKILALSAHSDASLGGLAGEIVAVDRTIGPIVAAGVGLVAFRSIQPAGKKPMTGAEFARGYHPEIGERFLTPRLKQD